MHYTSLAKERLEVKWRNYRIPSIIRNGCLYLVIGDKVARLQVVCEAESLDIFLQARRNVLVVLPKHITLYLTAEGCEEVLNLSQLLMGTRSSMKCSRSVVLVGFGGDIICHETMKEKYDFL